MRYFVYSDEQIKLLKEASGILIPGGISPRDAHDLRNEHVDTAWRRVAAEHSVDPLSICRVTQTGFEAEPLSAK